MNAAYTSVHFFSAAVLSAARVQGFALTFGLAGAQGGRRDCSHPKSGNGFVKATGAAGFYFMLSIWITA